MGKYLIQATAKRAVGHEDESDVMLKYVVDKPSYYGAYTALLGAIKNMGLRLMKHTIVCTSETSAQDLQGAVPVENSNPRREATVAPSKEWYEDTEYVLPMNVELASVECEWRSETNANHTA